jgi:predicted metal-binding membrane protein
MPRQGGLEAVLRRDRRVTLAALGAVTVLAWAYIVYLASQMSMGGMDMTGFRMAVSAAGMVMRPAFQPWTAAEFLFTLVMWVVMMIGMMIPSAAPVLLLYSRVGRNAAQQKKPFASTGWFLSGYLLAWTTFALAATTMQWSLDRLALLTPMMASASAILGSVVLIAAGAYQWTPLKDKCLTHCQSPIEFIQQSGGFPRDLSGSLWLGLRHGSYCIGCCWALMALLFVGGVMNVLWISGITILVLAEKVIPARNVLSRITGFLFVLAGVWLLVARNA